MYMFRTLWQMSSVVSCHEHSSTRSTWSKYCCTSASCDPVVATTNMQLCTAAAVCLPFLPGCTKCPAGTFNSAATSSPEACQPCPANSVAPKSGTKACTACRNNSTASADGELCVCPANFYVKQGRSRNRAGGRRLQQVWSASVKAADGDYDYKAPSCTQW
jgi:hypothetical protein